MKSLLSWLGLEREAEVVAPSPLRELVDALDRLEPEHARRLARFAYLLGRVAHADRHVGPEETRAMEALVCEQGQLSADQAMLVVSLAKTSNVLFGGTADYVITQEFADSSTYDEKLALVRCLFAIAASDRSISTSEEGELHKISNQLKILPADLTSLRLAHRGYLPGLAEPPGEGT